MSDLDKSVLIQIEELREKHEFLTVLVIDGELKIGVVQNETQKFVMLFEFSLIRTELSRQRFIELADQWWWESDQSEPIDVYFGLKFDEFSLALRGYPRKTITHHIGPTFNLADKYLRRIKKKKIEIINKTEPLTS